MNLELERKNTISKYYEQESSLPKKIKENLLNIEIELYGLIDLNESMEFQSSWLVLGENTLYLFKKNGEEHVLDTKLLITSISRIKEHQSLSSSKYEFLTADDMPPLLSVHFTGRQKIVLGHIKYLIETKMKSVKYNKPKDWNPDVEYQKAVLKHLNEAQSTLSDKQGKTFLRLVGYLKPYKKDVFWGTVGAICSTLSALLPAYLTGRLLDTVIKPFQEGGLQKTLAMNAAWRILAAIFLVFILKEVFSYMRLSKMSLMGEDVAMDLRTELFSHLQKLGLDFFGRKQTGSIISRVSSDTDRIWDFVAFGIVEVGIALVTLISLSAVLITLDWKLGLAMSLPVPILLLSIYYHGERMQKLFIRAWRKWSDLTNVLSDTIPGIQVVKAFNQEEKEIDRFNQSNDDVTGEFKSVHYAWTKFWPLLMMGIQVIVMTVWILAIPRLISEEGTTDYLSLGTFVSFLLYVTMFSQPIEVIGQMARMLNRALSSAYRIFEILDTSPSLKNGRTILKKGELKGDIEFKNVSFSYDGVRKVVCGINFRVLPGEMIGLVGSSGGGKSTITKLIARFFDVSTGEIIIDGKNLRELEVGSFRKQVGMVLQDPYLFHGTLVDNIRYGLPDVSLKKVIEAAKIANAHEFIMSFELGYETIVGERGHTLSGGERQRISIARAILHDPKILILDEATSAVDTETERKIQDALDKLIEGRTVFAVAHRLSTLRKANRIFVVDKGEIKETGTHNDLLKKKDGLYNKLHRMQQEMSENFV
ncbi:MAG: ABC transporter ATP-binding protein [Bacteriovoracaceae bacterium]|jgi:ATP-binding cassette, subfamily B, bacterial|nr:ABC transporter ATP-binding protein [Bacteriovoracaceae bacterium]